MKVALSPQEQETLTCAICGKTVKSIQGLRVHKGLSHKEKPEETPIPEVQTAPTIQMAPETVQDPPEPEPKDSNPVLTIHKPDETLTESEPISETPAVEDDQLEPAYGEDAGIQIDTGSVVVAPPQVVEIPEEETPLDPKALGIDEILVGSLLKLQGLHYIFEEQTIKGPELANGILVKVNFRWEDQGHKKFYLRAKSEEGSQNWIVSEEDVLNSHNVQLMSLGEKDTPENYMPEIPTSPEEEEVDEGPSPEEIAKQEKFIRAVDKYIQARDAKLEAEKTFKTADKNLRPVILEYLESCGQESDEGKGDKLVQIDDLKVHWTFTPGKDYIKKDESKILEFLKSNFYLNALEPKVNLEAWDKLKQNGTIPPQFVTEVEQPAKSDDVRKLLVEKL